jgi:hypothetical protein
MKEFLFPDHIPPYLINPKISVSPEGDIYKEYADGTSALIEFSLGDTETRYSGGGLHYENSPGDGGPIFIDEGHEDSGSINN